MEKIETQNKCLCGCGVKISPQRLFVSGHNSRVSGFTGGQFKKGSKYLAPGSAKKQNCSECGGLTKNDKFCSIGCYSKFPKSKETGQKIREHHLGKHPNFSNSVRENIRKSVSESNKRRTGWKWPEEKRLKRVGYVPKWSEEGKRKIQMAVSRPKSESAKRKMSEAKLKVRDELSRRTKKLWQDENYRKDVLPKMLKIIGPNKKECQVLEILKVIDENWKYVGNGEFHVGRKVPDFLNTQSNKLVEYFGRYWHQDDDGKSRIDYFKSNGYECLIILEEELKDKEKLRIRLAHYMEK